MQNHTKPQFDHENNCLKNKKGMVWKFVHHKDYTYNSNILQNRSCNFNWLRITDNGDIIIKGSYKKGYAWDGCTPKKNWLHITWGNFDGKLKRFGKGDYKPYTYYASMAHDVLYQYKRCVPVTRLEADRIFYGMLKDSGFMWALAFYIGVRLFGWWFKGWKYKTIKEIEFEMNSKTHI